ncbi:rh169 [macacine betaherpesvirus 3]|uniref:Rh169 n=1 Tax=Rhesus cytomegalovirus (strain 68-1) TaxID=47929 RepID=Q2FAD4_RHCM6|nr:rh169 [macacine betaherpesvirus 3]APT40223.1 Rh169 [macacine betaherpesvirus 3]QXV50510.1 protein O16 [macacine betaherpesvirus 3]
MRLLASVRVAFWKLKKCLQGTRSREHEPCPAKPIMVSRAVQTELTYSTPAAKHTHIEVHVDVSRIPSEKAGAVDLQQLKDQLTSLIDAGLRNVLDGVMLTGTLKTAIYVEVICFSYPIIMTGVIDTDNFSSTMANRFQKITGNAVQIAYDGLPRHARGTPNKFQKHMIDMYCASRPCQIHSKRCHSP